MDAKDIKLAVGQIWRPPVSIAIVSADSEHVSFTDSQGMLKELERDDFLQHYRPLRRDRDLWECFSQSDQWVPVRNFIRIDSVNGKFAGWNNPWDDEPRVYRTTRIISLVAKLAKENYILEPHFSAPDPP